MDLSFSVLMPTSFSCVIFCAELFPFVVMKSHQQMLSKWFCDISTGAVSGAARCVFLFEGDLVSWLLVMDERSGHKDLCCLNRRIVIPYVHGRTGVVLLKSALPEAAYLFFQPQ
jgi:hypothetical protein